MYSVPGASNDIYNITLTDVLAVVRSEWDTAMWSFESETRARVHGDDDDAVSPTRNPHVSPSLPYR